MNIGHIKRINKGFRPTPEALLTAVSIRIGNKDGFTAISMEDLCQQLKIAICKKKLTHLWDCNVPVDLSYFNQVWEYLNRYEFRNRKTAAIWHNGVLRIFKY